MLLSEEKALALFAGAGLPVVPHVCVTAKEDVPIELADRVVCRPVNAGSLIRAPKADVPKVVHRLIGTATPDGVVHKVLLYPHQEGMLEKVKGSIDWERAEIHWSGPVVPAMEKLFVDLECTSLEVTLINGLICAVQARLDKQVEKAFSCLQKQSGKIVCIAGGKGLAEALCASIEHYAGEVGYVFALHRPRLSDRLSDAMQLLQKVSQPVVVMDISDPHLSARIQVATFVSVLLKYKLRRRFLLRVQGSYAKEAKNWLNRHAPALFVTTDSKQLAEQAVLSGGIL